MPDRRGLARNSAGRSTRWAAGFTAATVAVLLLATGCAGSDDEPFRLGLLTDCQGPFQAFEEAQLSGAELPFLRRGASLAGGGPATGVEPITVAGRTVELVRGCQEVAEHTVFIEEARRLVETEHVDALVGGASVATRAVAHRYPDVPFLTAIFDEHTITSHDPAANLFRFTPDFGQQAAGLGAYAFRVLGWRRAAVLAGDGPAGWDAASAFTAEFCAVGGEVVRQVYRHWWAPQRGLVASTLAGSPDGVASFLTFFDEPVGVFSELLRELDDPRRQLLLWSQTLEDGLTLSALAPKLEGVVTTSWLPAGPAGDALRDYRAAYRRAFPAIPAGIGDASFVIGYNNAVEAILVALGRTGGHLGDGRRLLREELGRLELDLPGGAVTLDANRQAVRDMSLSRIAGGALQPVRTVPAVEQSFGGLLSGALPGPASQPCKKGTPPPWAR